MTLIPMHARTLTWIALAAAATLTACRGGFRVSHYPSTESLYTAGVREFERKKWTNAIAAFEKLTADLPARDTLLARSYWYLAASHGRQQEHLLAAQSFTRLFESFPDDTLADDAALQAARAYRQLWRKPALDASYGETAIATYNTLIGLYPASEFAEPARREIAELEQMFATKNYQTGLFYFRRKAYDSAIIYFRTVVERWPNVPRARDALLRLAQAYQAISYRDDFNDTCSRLRQAYPGDLEIGRACATARVSDTTAATPRPAPPAD